MNRSVLQYFMIIISETDKITALNKTITDSTNLSDPAHSEQGKIGMHD
jgi:hypothetical protein